MFSKLIDEIKICIICFSILPHIFVEISGFYLAVDDVKFTSQASAHEALQCVI